MEEIVEVFLEETQSESFRVSGSVTSHHRWTQIILDESPLGFQTFPRRKMRRRIAPRVPRAVSILVSSPGKPFGTFLVTRTILAKYIGKVNIVNISRVNLAKSSPNHLLRKERAFTKWSRSRARFSRPTSLPIGGCSESRLMSTSGYLGQKSEQISPRWDASL